MQAGSMISYVGDFGIKQLAGKAIPEIGSNIKVRLPTGCAAAALACQRWCCATSGRLRIMRLVACLGSTLVQAS